jgi:hypothetical protein
MELTRPRAWHDAAMMWFVALAIVAVVTALLLAQRKVRILQYLVLLRFPIVLGTLGMLLPLLTTYGPAAGMLDNLYVLDGPLAGGWVGLASAWLLAINWLNGELIFRAADERFGIAFSRRDTQPWANDAWLDGWLGSATQRRIATIATLGLGLVPLLVVVALRSPTPGPTTTMTLLGGALVIAWLDWESRKRPLVAAEQRLRAALPRAFAALQRRFAGLRDSELLRGYDDLRGHRVALWLLGLTALFYVIGAIVLPPWRELELARQFPAIGYVLTLLTLLALLLPALSFQLDLYRIPPIVALVVLLLPLQLVSDHDHYFVTQPPARAPARTPAQALEQRLATHDEPILVVVAASGGGGQAAVWTSRVFEGLAAQGEWGLRVLDSIGLVSTASGGSIGAMYWVDAYSPAGPPSDAATLARLRAAAEGPSLEALAWGLAYPDALRLVAPALTRAAYGELDRGSAMERVWQRRFTSGEAPTLAGWAQGVDEGWRPLHIMNATAVESGCRVLLASGALPHDAFAGAIPLPLAEHDLEVATAARLSAAFPYLSPASRAAHEIVRSPTPEARAGALSCGALDIGGQHLVDGGYYDNYGTVSAMQWLDHVLLDPNNRVRKVVILEIRSMSKQFTRHDEPSPGLAAQLIGPLSTLMSVRTSSQIDRNDEALDRFAAAWQQRGVTIVRLPLAARNEERLSWSLTQATIEAIRANWDHDEVVCRMRELCEMFEGESCPALPALGCPAQPSSSAVRPSSSK